MEVMGKNEVHSHDVACVLLTVTVGQANNSLREARTRTDENTTQSCVSTDLPEKLPVNVLAH